MSSPLPEVKGAAAAASTDRRRLVIGRDVPGRPEPAAITMELHPEDGDRARIVLHRACDTAEERDMAEEGSAMLLDGPTAFVAR
ncbi:hypothetical protein ACFW2V_28435 [Streptomyces sp. NPDC058947]|uniref:hypothetical protein n=1 Tax=Streptomyces TaxID=1883 RepID=UPI0036BF0882